MLFHFHWEAFLDLRNFTKMKHWDPAHLFDVGVHAEYSIKDHNWIPGCATPRDPMSIDCNNDCRNWCSVEEFREVGR